MVVIDRGRIVVAWGDSARRVKLSSIRKSLLNALYGAPVHDGGYLFLQGGNWNGTQIIPADWVRQSTTSYSETTGFGEGFGYGYLWWVHGYGLNVDAFSARGALGKYIVVIPERDLVVAFVNHTEFPDGPQAASAAEVKKLPDVPVPAMSKLLTLLLAAHLP